MKHGMILGPMVALSMAFGSRSCLAQVEPPQLVVMISIDQLRADIVDRFEPAFTGGIRRFLDAGYRFTQASHAHAVTETAAGHAALSTGVFPSRSGIVANDWRQRDGETWESMYAVEDLDSPILGVTGLTGRSPRNLLRDGLADWVLEADSDARVVSLSGKDRAAITMAGRSLSEVYWVVPELGLFATSEFYKSKYPGWITRFNQDVMPGIMADSVWDVMTMDPALRELARADSATYEGDGVHSVFPHVAAQEVDVTDPYALSEWAVHQPRVDRAVLALAREAVEEFDLGQRGHVDYLALALSATDHVGHDYGPFSQEQLNNMVHLDRELGTFLDYLDETVGEGRWVAAFTADHGVQTMPEYAASQGVDAERLLITDMQAPLSDAVQAAVPGGGSPDDLAERIARTLEERGLVAHAYTHRELTTTGQPADSFAVLYRNSYYPGRAPGWLSRFGVELRFRENQLVDEATGTTHGSPYWYDRHVPLIFLGAGVEPGSSAAGVYTVDVAPTLAGLAGIPIPYDLDGKQVYR